MPAPSNLYLLADGTYADPKACKKGDDGVLRHENGVGVATMATGEPITLGAVGSESRNAAAAAAGVPVVPAEPVVVEPAPAAAVASSPAPAAPAAPAAAPATPRTEPKAG